MGKLNLILLVLTIPNVISFQAPSCQTWDNSTTIWSCRNYRNFPTDLYNASVVENLKLELYGLPPLEKLTLNDLQLYKLPNLVELMLSHYRFDVVERGALQNGGKLVNLALGSSGMKTLDPQVFTDVPNLQTLEIHSADKNFENWEFPRLENLTELVLNFVRIPSLKPNLFKNLKSLQILDLSCNKITIMDDKEVFRHLTNLKILNLSWNKMSFVDPEVFADLQNLEILDLSFTNLEGFKNGTQFHNPNLITLDLNLCGLKYIEEDLFQNLGNLKKLSLWSNKLSHISPNTFSSLKNLETLALGSNSIKTLEPGIFSDLENLKSLDLASNKINSLDWKVLRNLKSLSTVYFNGNPWKCDCQFLYLLTFLNQRNVNLQNYFSSTCETVGVKEPIQNSGFMERKDIKSEKLKCLAFPNITKLSANKEPKLGESVYLQCDFSGDLPLQVIWLKGDVILRNFTFSEDEPLQNNRTLMEYKVALIIQNFKEEDAGLYKVVVSNEAGQIEKNEYLGLIKEPSTFDSTTESSTESNFGENSQSDQSEEHPLWR